MKSRARWALLWLAAPVCALSPTYAWALDPTLPHPGKSPAFVPAPQRPASPPAVIPRPPPTTTAPAGNVVPSSPPSRTITPAAATGEPVASVRVPVPDAAAQKESQKLVDQIYRENIAGAKTPELKKQLAQTFLKAGIETTNDLAGKYVLLIRARDLAADIGDADMTLAAIADAEKTFEVDAGSLDIDAISRLQKTVRGVEALRNLSRYLIGTANDAVNADQFEAARKLIDMAVATSGRCNDPALARLAAARAKEIREVETAYMLSRPSIAAATAGNADPAQNLTAGRYKCLYKGDFSGGVPLLAVGSDPVLKDLATKELSGVTGADQQLAVGDAWWDEADKLQGVPKNLALSRARFWYEQSEPFLTGLPKAKAIKRLKESEGIAALYAAKSAPSGSLPAVAFPPAPASGPTNSDPAPVPTGPVRLPAKFTREWKTPDVWKNKPELVTIKENRVTILNEGGTNTVCKEEEFTPQKDGSLVLTWDYGDAKAGYELWIFSGKEVTIQRWNSRTEKDSGKPARRLGFIQAK